MSDMNPIPGVSRDPAIAALLQSAGEGKTDAAKAEQEFKASRAREEQARSAQGVAMKPKQDQLQAALGNTPKAPETKPIPEAPKQMPFDTKEVGDTLALITTLAALGGALTRQPLTTALNAFSAGVQGFVKGDHAAYESKLKEFHAGVEKAKNENETVWKKYAAAKDKYKTDIAGLQNELKLIAAETQSPIDMELAKQGDVVSLLKIRETSRDHFQKAAATAARIGEQGRAHAETAKAHEETARHNKAMEEEKVAKDKELKDKAAATAAAAKDKEKAAATAKAETERRQRVRTFAQQYTSPKDVAAAVEKGALGVEMADAIMDEKFGMKPNVK